jgi:hypothetical protein
MKHFVAIGAGIPRAGARSPWQMAESRAKADGSTTKSLQANHWLPPLVIVVAGRKILPSKLIKICQHPKFQCILIVLANFLET